MTRSLRARLALVSLILIALALLALWYALNGIFVNLMAAETRSQLGGYTDFLAANVSLGEGGPSVSTEPGDARFLIPAGGRYWQVEIVGKQTLRSRSLWDLVLDLDKSTPFAGSDLRMVSGPDGMPLLLLHEEFELEADGGTQSVYVSAALNKSEFDAAVNSFSSQLGIYLGLAGVFLIAFAGLQIWVGLSPLRRIAQNVADVRSGKTRQISDGGPAEIRPLVSELNHLLEMREEAILEARTRADDLAHGLKTPLTILGQSGEKLAANGFAELSADISEQVDLIRRRVDRQLALARMSTDPTSTTEIPEMVRKLVDIAARLPSERRIEWIVDADEKSTIAMDATDFSEALGNILDNARKWARSKVWIVIRKSGEQMLLSIEDDGPGVSDSVIGSIAERGVRLDQQNSETGLGLAISREIVEAYYGALLLYRATGGGLGVHLSIPRVI